MGEDGLGSTKPVPVMILSEWLAEISDIHGASGVQENFPDGHQARDLRRQHVDREIESS